MNKQKILIVDDTPSNLVALEEILLTIDAEIITASNGQEAVREALKHNFDIIIIDIQMPDMSGFESIEYIRKEQKNRHIPVIFQSAVFTDEISKVKGVTAGGIDFITKPILSEELLRGKIKLLLELQRQTQELQITKLALEKKQRELEQANFQLKQMAFFDSLTGLPNRYAFTNQLSMEIARARREKQMLALLFMDLEKFKYINDTYGHRVGDEVLIEASNIFEKTIRNGDVLARLGGDEFIISLHNIQSVENAERVAAKINRAFEKILNIHNIAIRLTVSIGISFFPQDGQNDEELIRNSDMAMYKAKTTMSNSYALYNRELHKQSLNRLYMENGLSTALKNREFKLCYQPIVNSDKKIYGVETLIRWHSPDRGVIPPSEFIPVLENNRSIIEVTEWIITQACLQNVYWEKSGRHPLITTINLSAYQFQDPNLIPFLQGIIQKTQVNPRNIEIEITESTSMKDVDKSIEVLRELKKLQLKIAIDDFGTGFSSLNYLAQFPVDILKIDKSFTDQILNNSHVLDIIITIINLAKKLNMKIIAEGVENREQFDLLSHYGCDFIQGYYISEPLNEAAIDKYLLKHACI